MLTLPVLEFQMKFKNIKKNASYRKEVWNWKNNFIQGS